MADLALAMGGDLSRSPTGDVATVTGSPAVRQRVLRRLMTNPGDYIWHRDYGAGLGGMVGTPANVGRITAVILSQMSKEASVARRPAPTVTVTASPDGATIATIRFADAGTGASNTVTAPVGGV